MRSFGMHLLVRKPPGGPPVRCSLGRNLITSIAKVKRSIPFLNRKLRGVLMLPRFLVTMDMHVVMVRPL